MLVNLKAAPTEPAPVITFPPISAQKWVLPDGLTIIVQEDRSAPVASVQAWCATGSIDEDQHLGAGLSHILEHMLVQGDEDATGRMRSRRKFRTWAVTSTPTPHSIARFSGSMCRRMGLRPRSIFLSDAMMNSTLPPEEYQKEQEVIRREFAMGMDDPDRMAGQLLFATAYPETSVSVAGHRPDRSLQPAHAASR